jgi:leucyl/phenylalanyl-tRNA--protein transferase
MKPMKLLMLGICCCVFMSAHASERDFCKHLLSEFNQRPDDERLGLITSQVKMTPESLLLAYSQGIFPWLPAGASHAGWFSPSDRGVLLFSELRISSRDRQFLRNAATDPSYEVTIDQAFNEVVHECANMERWTKDPGTGIATLKGHWISPEFIENYIKLFAGGHAHSVEVWHHGILVAGLYGTFVRGVFGGESMFHKESNAAKLALLTLITRLQGGGHTFIDTQQSVGLLEKWGAREIPRDEFMDLLRAAQEKNLPF